jgi:HK97 family phage major capsid protein
VLRAYSQLTIKSVDQDRRVIRGVASSPQPDRAGDVIEPLGAVFAAEMPLLLHHNQKSPVGIARFDPPTRDGITFEAELPTIDEPGAVRDEVDRAWTSILHKLIRGVSIGYRSIDNAIEPLKSGGLRFLKTEILELSLVTIPANQAATIAVIKSFDQAATGRPLPASGFPVVARSKVAPSMKTQEQITRFENTRAAKSARMVELMSVAGDAGETLDENATAEYDGLAAEVKSIDAHLVRLHDLERVDVQTATPITPTNEPAKATAIRGGQNVITVKSLLPKATAFTRYVMATAAARGDKMLALEYAKQWKDSTPEVELFMKAAVAAGNTTNTTWALPLVPTNQNITGEFLELLRPKTILGKLSLRKVPFNVSVPAQTGGGTYGWVGEGKPKPLTALAFATVSLGFAKIAGIVVLTEELVKMSTPSAEETVREDMIAGVSAFMDRQFIDPAVAAVPTVNPASITNGVAAIPSSGSSADNAKTDIKALINTFVAANLSLENAALIMSEANAFALATALNPLGQPLFAGFTAEGGTIMGIKVVVSQAAQNMVILVDQRGVLYADDGQTTIDVSREASLQMDSAPTSPADATTVMVSLWQHNMVGLRVERMCTWARARTASVAWISGAAYV